MYKKMEKEKIEENNQEPDKLENNSEIDEEEEEKVGEEKNGEDKEAKKEKKKYLRKKQNSQIIWAILLMLALIVIVLAVPFIRNNYINKFNYIGLDFQKTQMGEIIFYSTRVPVGKFSKSIVLDKGNSYAIDFREDPRKLEYIKVDLNSTIKFKKMNINYISLESDLPTCEDNIIAVVGITDFLKSFGNLKVQGAMNNETAAEEAKFPYITCENSPENTVIYIKHGNQTLIKQLGEDCYELVYKDCEINKVSEKFILVVLEDYIEQLNE